MVTAEQRAQYIEDGYCLVPGLIPEADIIEGVRGRVLETIDSPPDWSTRAWQVIDPSRYTAPGRL